MNVRLFAREMGVTKAAVSKACKEQRLNLSVTRDERGRVKDIDPALGRREWAENTRPRRGRPGRSQSRVVRPIVYRHRSHAERLTMLLADARARSPRILAQIEKLLGVRTCGTCDRTLPLSAFFSPRHGDCRKCHSTTRLRADAAAREDLADRYVLGLLIAQAPGLSRERVPRSLIEAKRAQLRVERLITEKTETTCAR